MIFILQILIILAIAGVLTAWALAKRERDICRPLTNEERLLHYIDRRAEWECAQQKRKRRQRIRVERMLEQRWLARNDPDRRWRGPTVPSPIAERDAA